MKYEITSKKTGSRLEVEYDERNLLKAITFDGSADEQGISWILTNIPRKESALERWMIQVFDVDVIVEKISFDDFWDVYDHKVGKLGAEKQWSKLSLADRGKAIRMIQRYKSWCAQQNPPRRIKDPERYLSNQTFNDSFKL